MMEKRLKITLLILGLVLTIGLGVIAGRIISRSEASEHPLSENPYITLRQLSVDNEADEEIFMLSTVIEFLLEDDTSEGGVSLGVRPGVGSREEAIDEGRLFTEEGRFVLEYPQDTISISLTNLSFESREFVIKIFYNYIEVPFRLLGEDEYQTEFFVTLDGLYDIQIPIELHSSVEYTETLNKLTVIAFADPHTFTTIDENDLLMPTSMGLNFDLDFGFEDNLALGVDLKEPELVVVSGYGFSLNHDFYPNVGLTFPLQVRQNETVSLIYSIPTLLNRNVNSYLIVGMIDWQKISLNDQPYLFIKGPGNFEAQWNSYGAVSFEVPDEVGFYELAMFLVLNPTESNRIIDPQTNEPTPLNFFSPLETFRFTIEVIE